MTAELARRAKRGSKQTGRHSLIHRSEIVESILSAVEEGMTISSAAALSDVSGDTIYSWNARGIAEAERRTHTWPNPCADCGATTNTPPHRGHTAQPQAHDEEPFVQFAEGLARARASVERVAIKSIRSAIEGGFVKKDVLRTERNGDEVHEVEYAQPDGKLALEFLARTRPRDYGKINAPLQVQAEVSGPGGGPVQVEDAALGPLAQRIMAALEQQERDRETSPALTAAMLDKQAAERREPRVIEHDSGAE